MAIPHPVTKEVDIWHITPWFWKQSICGKALVVDGPLRFEPITRMPDAEIITKLCPNCIQDYDNGR